MSVLGPQRLCVCVCVCVCVFCIILITNNQFSVCIVHLLTFLVVTDSRLCEVCIEVLYML